MFNRRKVRGIRGNGLGTHSGICAALLVATLGCEGGGHRTRLDTIVFDDTVHESTEERGAVVIGDRGPGPGDGFSVSLGRDFGVVQAREVYRRLLALDASGAMNEFRCPGDTVPHFRFRMTFHEEGPLNERLISFGYTPPVEYWGAERCVNLGLRYLVERTFAQVDSGPSVEYGYTRSTGEQIPTEEIGERHARWRPTCRCDERETNREWVTLSPKETSVGREAQ